MKRLIILLTLSIALITSCAKPPLTDSNTVSTSENTQKAQIVIVLVKDFLKDTDEILEKLTNLYGKNEFSVAWLSSIEAKSDEVYEVIENQSQNENIQAIIAFPALRGTSEAFLSLKKAKPDLITISLWPFEDFLFSEAASSLVISEDPWVRAFMLVQECKNLGKTKFLHINSPFLDRFEYYQLRRAALAKACELEGLVYKEINNFADNKNPKVRSQKTEEVFKEILMAHKEDISDSKSAIFCPDPKTNQFFITEASTNSFSLLSSDFSSFNPIYTVFDITADKLKALTFNERARLLESQEVLTRSKVYTAWEFPAAWIALAPVLDFTRSCIRKDTSIDSLEDLKAWINRRIPGASFTLEYAIDPDSQVRSRNHIVFMQDSFTPGKGRLGLLNFVMPESLRLVRPEN